MANRSSLQPLLPATLSRPADVQEPSQLKRKRQPVACTSCQIKRTKCSGSSPCDECARTESDCHYNPSKDKRLKETLKKAQQIEEVLKTIVNILYQGTDDDLKRLKARVKLSPSPEESMEQLLNNELMQYSCHNPAASSCQVIRNLLSATVVLADGCTVNASAASHPDLYWGIRGGGGNFGVVVEFVFQAYEKPDDVFAGMLVYTLDKVPELVEFLNEWSSDQEPNEAALLAVVSPPPQNQPAIAVFPFYDGPEDTARDRFAKLISIGPIANGTSMVPYSKVNSLMLDGAKRGGRKYQAGAVWEPPFVLAQLDQVIQEYSRMLEADPETAGSAVLFQFDHPDKIASVPHDATAFANRGHYRLAMVEAKFKSANLDAVAIKYAKRIMQIVKEWDNGVPEGRVEGGMKIYSNYATGDEDPRLIFGGNLQRLVEIKKAYDPGNVFNKWIPV